MNLEEYFENRSDKEKLSIDYKRREVGRNPKHSDLLEFFFTFKPEQQVLMRDYLNAIIKHNETIKE